MKNDVLTQKTENNLQKKLVSSFRVHQEVKITEGGKETCSLIIS